MGTLSNFKIVVTPLAEVQTEGGNVLHAIKATDNGYEKFGEAYFSWINYGSIKAWKRHKRMIMNLVVPVGKVRFVFFKEYKQTNLDFQVVEIGQNNYVRLTVPPGIWFGFQGLQDPRSLILNLSSILHDDNEVERKSIEQVSYEWSTKA